MAQGSPDFRYSIRCIHYSLLPLTTFDRRYTYLLSRILIMCTSSLCRCLTVSYTPVHPLALLFSANPAKSATTVKTLITRCPVRLSSSSLLSIYHDVSTSYIFFSPCREMHPRCNRESTPLCTRAHIRTLARPRPGLLLLLAEKSVSLPRPGRRSVDTTATTLARHPRSTLSHPGIFVAHSRLRPCCRNAPSSNTVVTANLAAARARRFRGCLTR